MAAELNMIIKWAQGIHELVLGAVPPDGGSRAVVLRCGGENTLPFLFGEGSLPNMPLVAAEVSDVIEDDWPEVLRQDLKGVCGNPSAWAKQMVEESGADLVCIKLSGIHPDTANRGVKESRDLVKGILSSVGRPLVVLGCGEHEKDNEVLPAISEATKGERLLFGDVVQENYKTLTAACIADGHNIIAESPIDVNIAKQLNILISDLGLPLDRIAINPTIGALGYGLEYAYSIMERARNAGLSGDRMLAMPFICFVGQEAWRTKEAKVGRDECPAWGDARERAVMWEVVTALACLQAGANILTMCHPQAIRIVKEAIAELMKHSDFPARRDPA